MPRGFAFVKIGPGLDNSGGGFDFLLVSSNITTAMIGEQAEIIRLLAEAINEDDAVNYEGGDVDVDLGADLNLGEASSTNDTTLDVLRSGTRDLIERERQEQVVNSDQASLPVVSSSSSSTKFQSSPSSSVSNISAENVYSLSDMFPILSEAAVRSALRECGGDLSPAVDLLLTRDLMERERQEQVMNSDQTAPLCDLWVSGDCAGARAAACTARHFYLDSDSGGHGCRGKTKSAPDIASKKVKRVRRQFSSPYRARLVKEQIRVEREELSLV